VLVSDDLEMSAIAARWDVADAAVAAIAAGCDALLVCWNEEEQELAFEALRREAERSSSFRARCEQACTRLMEARSKVRAAPLDDEGVARVVGGAESQAIAQVIRSRIS
jgi:beta-N-acetylhexosaminidase